MAEAVEEPVLERLVGILRQLRREAVLLEELTGHAVELLPGDARANRVHRQVERLLDETVVADELLRRLAHAERPRHVGVAAGDGILRIQVGDDRLALRDRAVAGLVPDRRLLPVRDDDHVRGDHTCTPRRTWRAMPCSSSQVRSPPSRSRSRMAPIARSAACLRTADAGELRLVLRAPPLVEDLAVRLERDAVRAQEVGLLEREGARRDRALERRSSGRRGGRPGAPTRATGRRSQRARRSRDPRAER